LKAQRLPIEKAKWFIMHRGSGEYLDYGFPSKTAAMTEVSFLNGGETAAGRKPEFAVTPSKPRPRPELKVLKGGLS
jgi:hypothetical protein